MQNILLNGAAKMETSLVILITVLSIPMLPVFSASMRLTWSGIKLNYAPQKLRTCKTPQNACVELEACQSLARKIFFSKSEASLKLIGEYACELRHSTIKICCPRTHLSQHDGSEATATEEHSKMKLLNPENCGTQPLMNRMWGGADASPGEYPWMAILIYENDLDPKKTANSMLCGGSLINDRWVLTAAHCLITNKRKLPLRTIRLGEFDMEYDNDCGTDARGTQLCAPRPLEIGVEKTIAHESFYQGSRVQHSDIGLVKLMKSVASSDGIVPVCLPLPQHTKDLLTWTRSMPLTIAGWGLTQKGDIVSYDLHELRAKYVTQADCEKQLSLWRGSLKPTEVCARGENEFNACAGDSGGPLTTEAHNKNNQMVHYQVGIVSYGYGNCRETSLTIYTKVERFLIWILNNIE